MKNLERGGGSAIGVAEPPKVPVDVTRPAEKKRKRKASPILRGLTALGILTAGGTGVAIIAYETIPAVEQAVNRFVTGNNPQPEISDQLPLIVPTIEIPEAIVPKSFTIAEESLVKISPEGRAVNVTETTGIVRQEINTTTLTSEILDSVIKDNPDYFSEDRSLKVDIRHIFYPIDSDKNVSFKTAVVDKENYDQEERKHTVIKSSLGIIYDLHAGDVFKLPFLKAEIFRLEPLIVEGKEYYHNLLIKRVLPDGSIEYHVLEIYRNGNALDVEIADEFKNAPVTDIYGNFNNFRDWIKQNNGIPAEMSTGEDGEISAPPLLTVKKDLRLVLNSVWGQEFVHYTAVDENGDTKIVKPY